MGEQRLHAALSPSGAKAWMTCLGKPATEKGLPDNDNEYSDEGTCAHAIAALCLLENEPAKEYIGRVVDVGPGRTYEFREDMAAPVQLYVDLVRAYHASLPGSELHVEVEVPIDHVTGEEGATGTADVVILGLEEIITIDLKFGVGVEVEVEDNEQAQMYASGAIRKFDQLETIKRIRPVIIQPRLNPKPSEWDCTLEELRVFEARARERAKLSLAMYKGEIPIVQTASKDACRFCKAKTSCPTLKNFVVDTTGEGFEVMAEKVATGNSQVAVPDELAEIGRCFRSIPLIETWCKAVRAKAEGLLFETNNAQATIDALGIKLVQGKQGNRAWSNTEEAEKTAKHLRLTQEEMYDMSLKSPTQLEKTVTAKIEAGKVRSTAWSKLVTFVTRAPAKPSVADVNDKRPALVMVPSSDGFVAAEESLEDLG